MGRYWLEESRDIFQQGEDVVTTLIPFLGGHHKTNYIVHCNECDGVAGWVYDVDDKTEAGENIAQGDWEVSDEACSCFDHQDQDGQCDSSEDEDSSDSDGDADECDDADADSDSDEE